jgi:uncharacterized protein YqhQ
VGKTLGRVVVIIGVIGILSIISGWFIVLFKPVFKVWRISNSNNLGVGLELAGGIILFLCFIGYLYCKVNFLTLHFSYGEPSNNIPVTR